MGNMKYRAALYMRLSKDDGGAESSSIQSQRSLLLSYAGEHGFPVYNEYVDDGWSGTNFDRPEFLHMLSDIEAGQVNLVLVKDDCVIIEPTQKDLENQGFVAGSICF